MLEEDEIASFDFDEEWGELPSKKLIKDDNNVPVVGSGAFKTPESPKGVVKRKFPGPAGIISGESRREVSDEDETEISEREKVDLFGDLWREMLKDSGSSEEELSSFSIATLKKNAIPCQSNKSPILLAVIRSLDYSVPDPMCLLVDRSGSIKGMIHRLVMIEYSRYFTVGSVLVLKNVAILMTIQNHYVNVTLKNLLRIYHPSLRPQKLHLSSLTIPQILQDFKDKSMSKAKASIESKSALPNESPFVKPSTSLRASPKRFTFKEPLSPSTSRTESEEQRNLLDDLDEESLFGDF